MIIEESMERCAGHRNDRGFTIIEVIAVLIIMGILMAMTVPKILNTGSYSLACAAATIVADIRHAQHLAMTTHDDKNVTFTQSGDSYVVETENDGIFRSVDLPSGITVTSANMTFTFNPLGEPKVGGGGSVIIGFAGGGSKTITVSNYTGKVSAS